MWRIAAVVTVLIVVVGGIGGSWETWAIRYHPRLTITELIKRYTHLAIIVALGLVVLGMGFGYALGIGGR
jgi:hypothetical protein